MEDADVAGPDGALPRGISIEAWRSTGVRAEFVDWRRARDPGQGIIWIDVGDGQERVAIADVLDLIALPDYSRAFLGHVLAGIGPLDAAAAAVVPWYDDGAAEALSAGRPVTYLGAAALVPEVSPGPYEPPWVFECPVTMLVHDRWVITCRSWGHAMADGATMRRAEPYPRDRLAALAKARWRPSYLDGQDLAILILRAVVDTFPHGLAALAKRLRELQQDYVKGTVGPPELRIIDDHGFRLGLLQVKWVLDGLFIRMLDLVRPGVPATQRWLPVSNARDIADEIDVLLQRSEHDLRDVRDGVGSSFALASATQASEQLALSRSAQIAADRVEQRSREVDRVVDAIAVILLGPGLVAGIFAALPGIFDADENMRAALLGALTLATSLATYLGLRSLRSRASQIQHPETQSRAEPPPDRRLPDEAVIVRWLRARRETRARQSKR